MRFFTVSFILLLTVLLSSASLESYAQKTRILFVFDASNSMNGYWEGERKINLATSLLSQTLDELYGIDNLELGLRVYGHQTQHIPGQQDCDDTELVVPIGTGTNLVINKELERITPKGTTPIARSLEKAAGDFTDCEDCRNVIILITDGIEACDEDPCAVSRALQAKNIIVKPFIIGIGIDERYKSTFECVGNYFDATDAETFETVLDIVITQALNNTSVQINLLNANSEPKETNVPITLYDQNTGEILYHFVHTLNKLGNPDTLSFDPLPTYRMEVHTIPPIEKKDLKVTPGEHTTFTIPAAQGDLSVEFSSKFMSNSGIEARVSRDGCSTIQNQPMGSSDRYLVGNYTLEISTVPPTVLEGVQINPDETTRVVIPAPGYLLLNTGTSGYGGIFLEEDNLLEQVISFSDADAGGKYTLQPGKYRLLFRAKTSDQTIYSIEKEFDIKSGTNTAINLN